MAAVWLLLPVCAYGCCGGLCWVSSGWCGTVAGACHTRGGTHHKGNAGLRRLKGGHRGGQRHLRAGVAQPQLALQPGSPHQQGLAGVPMRRPAARRRVAAASRLQHVDVMTAAGSAVRKPHMRTGAGGSWRCDRTRQGGSHGRQQRHEGAPVGERKGRSARRRHVCHWHARQRGDGRGCAAITVVAVSQPVPVATTPAPHRCRRISHARQHVLRAARYLHHVRSSAHKCRHAQRPGVVLRLLAGSSCVDLLPVVTVAVTAAVPSTVILKPGDTMYVAPPRIHTATGGQRHGCAVTVRQ